MPAPWYVTHINQKGTTMSHQYYAPPPPPLHIEREPEARNGLGIAALVIAAVGVVFGLIPLTFGLALACAVAAGILVILAWVRIGTRRATNRAVTIIASVATFAAFSLSVWGGATFFGALDQLGSDLDEIGSGSKVTSAPATPGEETSEAEASEEPTEEPTEEEPAQFAMGDVVSISQEDEDGTEASVTVSGPRYQANPIDEWSDGPANKVFVIFTVKVECGAGKFDFSSSDFYVRTKDGDRFDVDDGNAYSATSKEQISYEQLNGGERKKGPMALDLPVRHGELVYDPNYEGEPLAVWKF